MFFCITKVEQNVSRVSIEIDYNVIQSDEVYFLYSDFFSDANIAINSLLSALQQKKIQYKDENSTLLIAKEIHSLLTFINKTIRRIEEFMDVQTLYKEQFSQNQLDWTYLYHFLYGLQKDNSLPSSIHFLLLINQFNDFCRKHYITLYSEEQVLLELSKLGIVKDSANLLYFK